MTLNRLLLLLILLLAGCRERQSGPPELPTQMDINARATEIILTQDAPPPGFSQISVPRIDANLEALNGWRYTADVIFDGVFASTTRRASAETAVEVSYNRIASARRVQAQIESNLQQQAQPVQYEAVRLGPDAFLVRDGVCLDNADEDADVVANLSAGLLVGGVNVATSSGPPATINGERVWRYTFGTDDLLLPSIGLGEDGEVLSATGELWFSPEHNAVIRYYLDLDVENVTIFGNTAPVSGTVLMRYDVYDIGDEPNLSVPFGC